MRYLVPAAFAVGMWALLLAAAGAAPLPPAGPDTGRWHEICSRECLSELLAECARNRAQVTLPREPLTRDTYLPYWARDGCLLRELKRRSDLLRAHPESLQLYNALADTLAYHVSLNPIQRVADFRDPTYRIEVPPYPELNVTDACTYALWLKLDGDVTVGDTKVLSHSNVTHCKFTFVLDPGEDVVIITGRKGGKEPRYRWRHVVEVGEWVHLAVTFSRHEGLTLWKNGEPLGEPEVFGPHARPVSLGSHLEPPLISQPEQPLYIGGQDRITPGWIDDVFVYNRALSRAEVQTLFRRESVEAGLVGGWTFDVVTEDPSRPGHARVTPNCLADRPGGKLGEGVEAGQPGVPPDRPGMPATGRSVRFSRERQAWLERLNALQRARDAVLASVLREPMNPPADRAPSLDALLHLLAARSATLLHVLESGDGSAAVAVCLNPRHDPPIASFPIADWPGVRRAQTLAVALLRDPQPEQTQEANRLLRRLGRALWDPVASAVDTREVWLRLPPELTTLPFAALIDSSGAYLVDHYAFSRTGPLAELTAQRPTGAVALAMGNPEYGAYPSDRPRPSENSGDLKRGPGSSSCVVPGRALYGSEKEVEAVAAILGDVYTPLTLTGTAALETSVKELAPQAALVHLATHNFRLDARCLEAVPDDPRLCVGLQWAGTARVRPESNRLSDDGLFSAQELSRLELAHHPLVVFSGCSTALSPDGGTLGLPQAAWLAGASASVVTLWDVDDWAMLTPMKAFYTAWLEGAPVGIALQRALVAAKQETLLQRGTAHPGYWAALVVEGLR